MKIVPARHFCGSIQVPGDKSISHRALILGSLASGVTDITGLSEGQDVLTTLKCLEVLGVSFKKNLNQILVYGKGLESLEAPAQTLDCGNSGTTMRLLMGVLAGQNFSSRLTGDSSLMKRPMERVAIPLRKMGAQIQLSEKGCAPVEILPVPFLHGISYSLEIPSAQIKSALLLAGLFAKGDTVLSGRVDGRDHLERMFPEFGVSVFKDSKTSTLRLVPPTDRKECLEPTVLQVPGDMSSAAFWIAAACLIKNSHLEIKNVSLNPSRLGFLNVLERMGAQIQVQIIQSQGEPFGNLKVSYSQLRGTQISASEVPALIDELPLIAVMGACASGVTEVKGAEELRVKETDRIQAIAQNFEKMGIQFETFNDGFRIQGRQKFRPTILDSFHDHRIAMAFSVAALVAAHETQGESVIENSDCVAISYPDFYQDLKRLAYE